MTFCIPLIYFDAIIATCYLSPRSLEYRHGSVVTEVEQVGKVEVKSEEQELPLDQPWQLSEEVLEDFYDVPQDDVEEDVNDTKSLGANVPEENNFGEKGTNNEQDQIQTSIEEFEIFKLNRELERKKQELVVKLETMGLKQKNLMGRSAISKGIFKEDQEKEPLEVVKVACESQVTEEPKAIDDNYYQDSSKEFQKTNDEIKKSSKIKKRRSRKVNPLMKKTVVKLSQAGRMKRDL